LKNWLNNLLQTYLDSKNSEDAAIHFEEFYIFKEVDMCGEAFG
jgi:hypothetical protein